MKSKDSIRVACVAVLLTVTVSVQEVDGGLIVFTDRTSFNTAAGSTTLEDFNSFVVDTPFHTTPLDVGDFTLSMTGSPNVSTSRNYIDIAPPQFSTFNIDGTNIANVLTTTDDSLFFTFDTAIYAFGADFAAFNDKILRTRIFAAGVLLTPPVSSGSVVSFYGFVSDTPFTTVEFRSVSPDGYAIDNVAYSSQTAVPEPSTFALLCIGGIALVGYGARPKRQQAA